MKIPCPQKAGAELYPALRHPTLGNYLGAMRNWVGMQDEFDCAFAVADLHAITVRQEPAKFRRQINEMFALLLAIGLDRRKTCCSCSRGLPAHAELAWLLSCHTQFGGAFPYDPVQGQAQKHADNINLGLFAYPSPDGGGYPAVSAGLCAGGRG